MSTSNTHLEALVEAQQMYASYLEAERTILQGQSYSIGDRTLTRADLSEVQKGRQFWAGQVCALASGKTGIRLRRVIPRDL
jgi:hypothetical protein